MKAIYGPNIFRGKTIGRGMFPEIPAELQEKHDKVKSEFLRIRGKSRRLRGKLERNWIEKDVLKVAHDYGADLSAFTRYYDPYFGKIMCMLVFALNYKELKTLKIPSFELEQTNFSKSTAVQDITNKISENFSDEGIFCEPVPHGTYFGLDNIEFNQVRLAEKAFGGEIGKNNLLLLEGFGPRFRVGMVIFHNNKSLKIPKPKTRRLCKGYYGKCDVCVKACPSGALAQDNVLVCSEYFISHNHCSLCAKVCPVE